MAYNYGYPGFNPGFAPYQGQQIATMQQSPQIAMQPVQPTVQPQQSPQGLSSASRPVTNREEAIGVPADFSGAPMVFPDLSNNRVYLKRWNMQTGSADFWDFAPVIPTSTEQQKTDISFASLQDFQDLKNTVTNLQKEIEQMKKPTQNGRAVKKNDSSDE